MNAPGIKEIYFSKISMKASNLPIIDEAGVKMKRSTIPYEEWKQGEAESTESALFWKGGLAATIFHEAHQKSSKHAGIKYRISRYREGESIDDRMNELADYILSLRRWWLAQGHFCWRMAWKWRHSIHRQMRSVAGICASTFPTQKCLTQFSQPGSAGHEMKSLYLSEYRCFPIQCHSEMSNLCDTALRGHRGVHRDFSSMMSATTAKAPTLIRK